MHEAREPNRESETGTGSCGTGQGPELARNQQNRNRSRTGTGKGIVLHGSLQLEVYINLQHNAYAWGMDVVVRD